MKHKKLHWREARDEKRKRLRLGPMHIYMCMYVYIYIHTKVIGPYGTAFCQVECSAEPGNYFVLHKTES